MNRLERIIMEILKSYGSGKKKAIKGSDICRLVSQVVRDDVLGVKSRDAAQDVWTRELRLVIRGLQKSGVPICASSKGFFLAETEDECQEYARQLRGRAFSLLEAASDVDRNRFNVHRASQTSLALEGR